MKEKYNDAEVLTSLVYLDENDGLDEDSSGVVYATYALFSILDEYHTGDEFVEWLKQNEERLMVLRSFWNITDKSMRHYVGFFKHMFGWPPERTEIAFSEAHRIGYLRKVSDQERSWKKQEQNALLN